MAVSSTIYVSNVCYSTVTYSTCLTVVLSIYDVGCWLNLHFCREGLVHRPRFAWRCVQQQPMSSSSTKDDFEDQNYERDKGRLIDDYKTDDTGPAPDP